MYARPATACVYRPKDPPPSSAFPSRSVASIQALSSSPEEPSDHHGPPSSPGRHRLAGGTFQRRLADASAAAAEEAAVAPRIGDRRITPVSPPPHSSSDQHYQHAEEISPGEERKDPERRSDIFYSSISRISEHSQGQVQRTQRLPAGGDSGGGGVVTDTKRWTERTDRLLTRLVREYEFDFDRVAARISMPPSAGVEAHGVPLSGKTSVHETVGGCSLAVSARECRVRFSVLDAAAVAGSCGADVGDTGGSYPDEKGGDAYHGRADGTTGSVDARGDYQGRSHVRPASSHRVVASSAALPPGVLENAGLSFDELEKKSMHSKSR